MTRNILDGLGKASVQALPYLPSSDGGDMPAQQQPLAASQVFEARRAIAPFIRRTPLIRSDSLSERLGCEVHLKLESLQETGSFKLRGATNRLSLLSHEERARGVVLSSTGNHARGVAYAGRRLGVRVVVCMSALVPKNKVEAVGAHGADVRIVGRSQDEAEVEAKRLSLDEGLVFVSPFDDAGVICGQGTIGLELLEDMPDVDTVLVPLSGGGLIGGIALALKAANPAIRVVGITTERGAAMIASLRAGRPVEITEEESLADSLGGGIGLDNRYTFALVRDLVEELILVSEQEIADGMAHVYWREQLVVEGGAAVGVAALLHDKVERRGNRMAVVLSGRNVDMQRFTEIVARRS
jgi:threonine dehydratase